MKILLKNFLVISFLILNVFGDFPRLPEVDLNADLCKEEALLRRLQERIGNFGEQSTMLF